MFTVNYLGRGNDVKTIVTFYNDNERVRMPIEELRRRVSRELGAIVKVTPEHQLSINGRFDTRIITRVMLLI